MKVVLELQDQPSNIKRVTVRHDIVIGRGAECNLRLSAPQVSRRHCFLRIGSEGAYVSDLDSSNGTTLDGKKLTSGKRYQLDDGAVLAVGPIRFVARVESEVKVAAVPESRVGEQRIESGTTATGDDSHADDHFEATIATPPLDGGGNLMNFSIEHAGPNAAEDEPTADCLNADSPARNNGSAKSSPAPVQAWEDDDESLLGDLSMFDDEPETIAAIEKAGELFKAIDDDEIVEVVEIIDDAIDVVDVIDEEIVEIVDDDEVLEIIDDDEVLEIIEEDEVLLVDEDEIIELGEESELDDDEILIVEKDPDYETGDSVEDELKNFLKGLD